MVSTEREEDGRKNWRRAPRANFCAAHPATRRESVSGLDRVVTARKVIIMRTAFQSKSSNEKSNTVNWPFGQIRQSFVNRQHSKVE